MQQEQQKRAKQKKHIKLQQKIKKEEHSQDFGNLTITYSYLDKKNNSGTGSNNRLFFLIHNQRVGYINQLPKGQLLPFQNRNALPKLKAFIELDNIQKAISQKQILKISFNKADKKQTWEFTCPSQNSAQRWARYITGNLQKRKDDKLNPPKEIKIEQRPKSVKPGQQGVKIQGKQGEKSQRASRPLSNNQNQLRNESPVQNIPILPKDSLASDAKMVEQNINPKQRQMMRQQNNQQNFGQSSQAPKFGFKPEQKSSMLKPTSSLFVGGMSVSNQKDQTQLKNRMESFQAMTSRIREQYQRKKEQQKKLHEQIKNESSQQFSIANIGNNILSFSTNTKYQIQKMQREWGYQFAKSQNQYEIVQKFKFYVEAVSRKLIDELGLEEKKRYYQPSESTNNCIRYQINGVLFEVYLTELKQTSSHIYSHSEKVTILLNQAAKMSAHQFKNYNYILKLTQNKGKIRVPLSMMTQYKGMKVYAKVLIPSAEAYQKMQLLQKQLQILQAQSRINNSIFQDPEPDTGRIVALNSKAYQKLARAQNSARKFDICYIEGLKHYLPHDFNNFNKDKPYQRLRWQLIQDDQCQDKILYGQDMCAISNRLKLPQHLRDGMSQLTQISKLILNRIDILVQQLESVDQYFTNSQQLSHIMHRHGINMRYLGAVLEKLKQNWLKQLIMSQICARCAKKYLNFDLQDCILNLSQTNIQNVYKFHIKQLLNFLNKMFGNSQQTQIFWKQLNRQSQTQYKISINRQQINTNYLLQSLQYHGCFKLTNIQYNNITANINKQQNGQSIVKTTGTILKASSKLGLGLGLGLTAGSGIGLTNSGINTSSIANNHHPNNLNIQLFTSPTPFNSTHIASFQNKSKVYNLQFTQMYNSISSIISQHTSQSVQQLKLLLNLNRVQNISTHFKLSNMYQNIILFLIYWVSPAQNYNIYHPEQVQIQVGQVLPSKLLYMTKLAQIRWGIKQGKVEQTQKIKQWIVDHINKWIGQSHPILTQLYQMYANHYMTLKDQQKKAINYCKSVIRNQQQLIGVNHYKMADCYYLLGTIYVNYGKKLQAINSLKKAKEIILKSTNQQSQAYGQVSLKMGQLFLAVKQSKQAAQAGLQAMNILENCQNSQAHMQAIQLVCRCYEVEQDWESYLSLIQNTLVHKIPLFVQSVELTEKIIKVCILPSFKIIAETNSSIAQKILKIMAELPDTTRAPNMAYNFLKARIQEKVFPHKFLQALSDIEEILEEIESNGMLARWKGFQNLSNKSLLNKVGVNLENKGFNFIANLEALNIFIGNSFIEGILLDQ